MVIEWLTTHVALLFQSNISCLYDHPLRSGIDDRRYNIISANKSTSSVLSLGHRTIEGTTTTQVLHRQDHKFA